MWFQNQGETNEGSLMWFSQLTLSYQARKMLIYESKQKQEEKSGTAEDFSILIVNKNRNVL